MLAIASAVVIVYARRQGAGLGSAPMSLHQRCRWWAFLVAKSALLLIAAGLLAWASIHSLAVTLVGSAFPMADGMALWLFLMLAIAPLSWSVRDQQKRCRVCLRRLGIPIRIGAPGSILFDGSGTEMVCAQGHGVLYLPDSGGQVVGRRSLEQLGRFLGRPVPRRMKRAFFSRLLSHGGANRQCLVDGSRQVGDAEWLLQKCTTLQQDVAARCTVFGVA